MRRRVNALIVYLVVGLAVGLLAPLVAGRPSMGVTFACLVGAIGAFIGGVVGSCAVPDDQFMVVRLGGVVASAIGAALTLALVIIVHEQTRAPFGRSHKKRANQWRDGLLLSDRRSFETISKQHQRSP